MRRQADRVTSHRDGAARWQACAPPRWSWLSAAAILFAGLAGAVAQPRPLRLVALGDSLTAGYGLPAEAAFPQALERALRARGHKVEIANAGVSGDTATAGLDRLDWSVPDGTDGVILELGANDMLRGLDPAVPRKAHRRDRGAAEGPQHPGPARRHVGGAAISARTTPRASTSLYPEIAERARARALSVFPGRRRRRPQLSTCRDGLHPTAKGVEIIVERMLPTVETFLKRLTPS